jgi:Protein of unknown function (DUF3040)
VQGDHEREALDALERQLIADDPGFVRSFQARKSQQLPRPVNNQVLLKVIIPRVVVLLAALMVVGGWWSSGALLFGAATAVVIWLAWSDGTKSRN